MHEGDLCMNERIYKDSIEEGYHQYKKLCKMQLDLDTKKKRLQQLQKETRSFAQLIPNQLRKDSKRFK